MSTTNRPDLSSAEKRVRAYEEELRTIGHDKVAKVAEYGGYLNALYNDLFTEGKPYWKEWSRWLKAQGVAENTAARHRLIAAELGNSAALAGFSSVGAAHQAARRRKVEREAEEAAARAEQEKREAEEARKRAEAEREAAAQAEPDEQDEAEQAAEEAAAEAAKQEERAEQANADADKRQAKVDEANAEAERTPEQKAAIKFAARFDKTVEESLTHEPAELMAELDEIVAAKLKANALSLGPWLKVLLMTTPAAEPETETAIAAPEQLAPADDADVDHLAIDPQFNRRVGLSADERAARRRWPGPHMPTGTTWAAYAEAYRERYGTDPVWNGKQGGMIGQLVKRIGRADAPRVAAFYVRHNDPWYLKQGHAVGILLQQCEKLRTEWATGQTVRVDTRPDPMDAARVARERREARERAAR